MRNIRLLLAYDGTDFRGWQRQPNAPTIQGCIEDSIRKVLGERTQVWASGRTDAGVHALNQVANFKTSSPIPCENLFKALNDVLPPTIRVKRAEVAPDEFHARYQARAKTYRYRILQAPVCSPFLARFVYHYPYPLSRPRMAEAAQLIEGQHDFTSFAGAHGRTEDEPSKGARSLLRHILKSRILWHARTSILIYEVQGSGFLHHMVRNLVGTLIEIGKGKLSPRDILRILEARDRSQAGATVPAKGLFLVKVEYGERLAPHSHIVKQPAEPFKLRA